MTDRPPSSYDFVPLPDRPPLKFPDSARVALIFTINIEYWEPSRPGQKEPMFPGGPATIPHALPGDVLDTAIGDSLFRHPGFENRSHCPPELLGRVLGKHAAGLLPKITFVFAD